MGHFQCRAFVNHTLMVEDNARRYRIVRNSQGPATKSNTLSEPYETILVVFEMTVWWCESYQKPGEDLPAENANMAARAFSGLVCVWVKIVGIEIEADTSNPGTFSLIGNVLEHHNLGGRQRSPMISRLFQTAISISLCKNMFVLRIVYIWHFIFRRKNPLIRFHRI